jgi:hypothetical protein
MAPISRGNSVTFTETSTKRWARIVNDVGQMAGTRAKFIDSPIQRFQRDISSLATHAAFDLEQVGDQYGGMLMGVDPPPNAMI